MNIFGKDVFFSPSSTVAQPVLEYSHNRGEATFLKFNNLIILKRAKTFENQTVGPTFLKSDNGKSCLTPDSL